MCKIREQRSTLSIKYILMLNFLSPPWAKILILLQLPSLKNSLESFWHEIKHTETAHLWSGRFSAYILEILLLIHSRAHLTARSSLGSLGLAHIFHSEEHCSTSKTFVYDLILMFTTYYLCLKVQESFTKSSTDFKRLACKNKHLFFSRIHS